MVASLIARGRAQSPATQGPRRARRSGPLGKSALGWQSRVALGAAAWRSRARAFSGREEAVSSRRAQAGKCVCVADVCENGEVFRRQRAKGSAQRSLRAPPRSRVRALRGRHRSALCSRHRSARALIEWCGTLRVLRCATARHRRGVRLLGSRPSAVPRACTFSAPRPPLELRLFSRRSAWTTSGCRREQIAFVFPILPCCFPFFGASSLALQRGRSEQRREQQRAADGARPAHDDLLTHRRGGVFSFPPKVATFFHPPKKKIFVL